MPADFIKCVQSGGRVRTKKLSGEKYLHICYDNMGKSHAGEIKEKQSNFGKELVKRKGR